MKEIRHTFIESCNKITDLLQDKQFKAIQKGQTLKKTSENKDLIYELSFQSSFRNTNSNITITPTIQIYSKQLKKWMIDQTNNQHSTGIIVAEHLGYITPYKSAQSWDLAGLNAKQSIEEIADLINRYALPIFNLFDNLNAAIDFLAINGQQFNNYIDNSLRPLGFMIFFAPKKKANQFFNHFISNCKYKARIIELYKNLETRGKIDLNYSEFYYASEVKLAYNNKLIINA